MGRCRHGRGASLRPQAPRLSDPMGFRRPGRGASSPASPYSFVEGHHVLRSGWADALTDVVLRSPQTLISSSTSTTSLGPDGLSAARTWCFISRKPLFLRPQAPRLSGPAGFRRPGRGASPPANPYFFVHEHHVPRVRWAFGGPMRLEKEFFHNRTCFDIVDIRNRFFPNPYMPLQKKGVCP